MMKSWYLFSAMFEFYVKTTLCGIQCSAGAKNGHFGQLFAFHEREVNPPQFKRQSTMDSK